MSLSLNERFLISSLYMYISVFTGPNTDSMVKDIKDTLNHLCLLQSGIPVNYLRAPQGLGRTVKNVEPLHGEEVNLPPPEGPLAIRSPSLPDVQTS